MATLLELQRRFIQGDEASFRDLMRATSPRLYRLALRLLNNPADAEDVLQESYLRAYAFLAAQRFRQESAVETWLWRIATNAAIDLLRRRRPVHALRAPPGTPSAEAQVEARLALERLSELLSELPPEQRAALVLKELEGLSSAQVGEILGCSEGAVEQRLVRARRILKERSQHHD
jgi:RNA polymerase sigma-70 factor (ECF subfamily)